jgi:hypothetical protein
MRPVWVLRSLSISMPRRLASPLAGHRWPPPPPSFAALQRCCTERLLRAHAANPTSLGFAGASALPFGRSAQLCRRARIHSVPTARPLARPRQLAARRPWPPAAVPPRDRSSAGWVSDQTRRCRSCRIHQIRLNTPSSSRVISRKKKRKNGGVGSCGPQRRTPIIPHHSKKSCTVFNDHSHARLALGCVWCTAIATMQTRKARRQLRPSACCGWKVSRSPRSSGGIVSMLGGAGSTFCSSRGGCRRGPRTTHPTPPPRQQDSLAGFCFCAPRWRSAPAAPVQALTCCAVCHMARGKSRRISVSHRAQLHRNA